MTVCRKRRRIMEARRAGRPIESKLPAWFADQAEHDQRNKEAPPPGALSLPSGEGVEHLRRFLSQRSKAMREAENNQTVEDHLQIARDALAEAEALFNAIEQAAFSGGTVKPCAGSLAVIGARICDRAHEETDSAHRSGRLAHGEKSTGGAE